CLLELLLTARGAPRERRLELLAGPVLVRGAGLRLRELRPQPPYLALEIGDARRLCRQRRPCRRRAGGARCWPLLARGWGCEGRHGNRLAGGDAGRRFPPHGLDQQAELAQRALDRPDVALAEHLGDERDEDQAAGWTRAGKHRQADDRSDRGGRVDE